MRKLRNVWVLLATVFAFTVLGLAQEGGHYEFGASGGGVAGDSTQGNGVHQNMTRSMGLLGTFRLRLTDRSSLALNYGRTLDSQKYVAGPFSYRIPAQVTELSGAYTYNLRKFGRMEPFVFAGGGALVFAPRDTLINTVSTAAGAVRQTRPAGLFGAAIDYRLYFFHRFFLRVEYHGLLYQPPDFKVANIYTGGKGFMEQATAGLVFRF
jgi:preprotein translocase subunit SecG